MPEREGQRMGNYRLHRLLGKGSFAEVYLGEHLYLKTSAAIKVLHTALNEKDEQLFLSESQMVAQLVHPNIVRVREFAIERSTPFLVMDYAPGGTLRHRYPSGVCLSLEKTVLHVSQIAAALQYAHNKGIVHRDIKAENILQGAHQVMLSDFGISVQAPKPGMISSQEWAGTLAYMAPEQFQGQAVFASDQYALAVLAYEWLCGVRPFEGSGLGHQHMHAPPPRLREKDSSLPQEVETVIMRALSKQPEERYVSVINFARALERASHTKNYALQTSTKTAPLEPQSPQRALARSVFLSHAAQDDITRLHADLSARDILVQGDASEAAQEEEIRQAIRAAQAVCLVLTPHTHSSAIVQQHLRIATLYGRKVLCLWAQGDELNQLLPPGTEQAIILDARGPRYKETLDDILSFLEREQRGVVPKPVAFLHNEPRNPYKGLRTFTGQDRADFFGRRSVVQELLAQLRKMMYARADEEPVSRFLAVIGPSGSGKSSIVLAGLLPRLQENVLPGSDQWVYLDPLVPGKQPLEALAQVLAARAPDKGLQAIRDMLKRDGGFGLHQLGLALMSQPETRIVVIIDQFEELFSAAIPEPERAQYIQLLVTAASEPQGSVLILLTLRADFYDRPFAYPELGRLIQNQQCAVLPMSSEDLREVIERPAALPDVAVTFDEDLVGDLLFDLREQVGALPLLEFTLDQLFQHRRERRLTRFAYQEIGGVRGALSKHADATYAALPSDEHRQLARTLFMRLIQPATQEQEAIRRRAEVSEFVLEQTQQTTMLREVIDAFVAARLITLGQAVTTSTLEVSHEALIREWPRLTTWLQEARTDIQVQQAISKDMSEWEQRGKPKDRLYGGSRLKEALAWQKRNAASGHEAAFLRAGRTRRTQRLISILLVVVMLFALLGTAGFVLLQPYLPLTVTTLQDDVPGSLRQAVANVRPGNTIIIDANLKGTLVLNRTLTISRDLTIRGPGVNQLTVRGARNYNGLIYIFHNSRVTLSQLTFSDPAPAYGSMIRNEGALTLDHCSVTGNTNKNPADSPESAAYGGAIMNNGGDLTLQNSIISRNTVIASSSFGGGIYSDNGGTIILKDSQIVDNKLVALAADAIGGGLYSIKGKIILSNSTIARNQVIGGHNPTHALQGGGIFSQQDTILLIHTTIANNSIESNAPRATTIGGGILTYKSSINIQDSHILSNTLVSKDVAGGGGLASQGGTLTLQNSSIAQNSITANTSVGGGIDGAQNTTITLKDSQVVDNKLNALTTIGFGGGIYSNNNKVTLNNSTIARNSITGGQNTGLGGGGLYNQKDTIALTDSTVTNNTIESNAQKVETIGGGIASIDSQTSINKSTISNNNLTGDSSAKGGGIYSDTTLAITNSVVSSNSVHASATDNRTLGGGIWTRGTLTLDKTTLSLNIANSNKGLAGGGGLFAQGTTASSKTDLVLHLTNCTIANNKAQSPDSGGGGVSIIALKSNIDFCTIYGNSATAGGGIITDDSLQPPAITLQNSIVAGNSATSGPDISGPLTTNGYNLIQQSAGATLNDPQHKHNTDISGDHLPTLGIATSTSGGPTPTLALQAGSPAINVIPASSCDLATDQRGVKRPQQGTCDIGAYEYSN